MHFNRIGKGTHYFFHFFKVVLLKIKFKIIYFITIKNITQIIKIFEDRVEINKRYLCF